MKEKNVHQQVVTYLKLQYPNLIFHTDFAAGCKMTKGQAVQNSKLQSGRGFPDLFIAQPTENYHGLFLELKRDGTIIYKKNGELRKDEHLEEQALMLLKLNSKGYYAKFAVGFDEAKQIIQDYLTNK